VDCGTELFSHLLNTFHMMPNHCTDRYDAVAPFDLRRGRAASVMLLNGLDPEWWEGSVYGNPPYGRIIERTRKLAARTAAGTAGFRATLVIPLEDGVIHNLSKASGQTLVRSSQMAPSPSSQQAIGGGRNLFLQLMAELPNIAKTALESQLSSTRVRVLSVHGR
jgi:hypothetical protein